MWVVGALLAASLLSVRAEDVPAGFAAIEVEPPAPVVVEPAAPQSPDVASAAPIDLGLPESPQVTVEMPAPEARPVQTAEASAPVEAGDPLVAALQQRLADATLPLPPKFLARDREALAAAYASGDHRPLWIKDGAWNPAAEALMERLGRADEDGLDPNDYPAPRLGAGASAADLAEAELKLSAAAYLYARDARGGRIEPNRLGGLITPKLDLPGVERVLATLAASEDPGATLQGFNPRYPGYQALREKLAEIRAQRPSARAKGRQAGTVLASVAAEPPHVRLSPRLEGDILANMERWRWLPARVGERYILVNIPEFRLRLVDEGRVIHEARVITGTPATPTPVFSDMMDHAIVNPSWFVPASIQKNMNLANAAKRGYTVASRRGVTTVRVPPGPSNPLGNVKYMFPNDHAVYLHDTSSRGLFANGSRALSHGCVRLEHPFALGGKILGSQWSEQRLKGLVGYGERTIKLDERLPIHLSYFTLYVNEYGELKSFGDIYGHDRRVRRALGLGA